MSWCLLEFSTLLADGVYLLEGPHRGGYAWMQGIYTKLRLGSTGSCYCCWSYIIIVYCTLEEHHLTSRLLVYLISPCIRSSSQVEICTSVCSTMAYLPNWGRLRTLNPILCLDLPFLRLPATFRMTHSCGVNDSYTT